MICGVCRILCVNAFILILHLSSNLMKNCCRIMPQSRIGMVHFQSDGVSFKDIPLENVIPFHKSIQTNQQTKIPRLWLIYYVTNYQGIAWIV